MVKLTYEKGFKIDEILECGQCFRFTQLDDMTYALIHCGKRLRVSQKGSHIEFDCTQEEFDTIWYDYFDLGRDYVAYMTLLKEKDFYLKEAVEGGSGLRILNQDPFEMVIAFILSQNKSIPQIKTLVERLCEHYGALKEDHYGKYYAFPTPEALKDVTEEEFRALKVGFRAPYLVDAVKKIVTAELSLLGLKECTTNEAREKLMSVKGIGRKVADCILLFGYGRADVFPVDVWVRRVMTELYFEGVKTSDKKILDFADDYFGHMCGIAQQYLFYHGRDKGFERSKRK